MVVQRMNKHLNLDLLLKFVMRQHSVQDIVYFGSEKAAVIFCCILKHLHAKIEVITKGYATDKQTFKPGTFVKVLHGATFSTGDRIFRF